MVDLVVLQSISYIAGSLGVCIAAIFYVLNLRISQRNMKQTLETRQFQMLMQLADIHKNKETFKDWIEFVNMEWNDYDDFEKKYDSNVNPDNYAIRDFVSTWFKKAGIILRYGMVDKDLLYDFLGEDAIGSWNKYEGIVRIQRELYSAPDAFRDWEYLYGEMVKVAERRGRETSIRVSGKYTDELREKVIGKKP